MNGESVLEVVSLGQSEPSINGEQVNSTQLHNLALYEEVSVIASPAKLG